MSADLWRKLGDAPSHDAGLYPAASGSLELRLSCPDCPGTRFECGADAREHHVREILAQARHLGLAGPGDDERVTVGEHVYRRGDLPGLMADSEAQVAQLESRVDELQALLHGVEQERDHARADLAAARAAAPPPPRAPSPTPRPASDEDPIHQARGLVCAALADDLLYMAQEVCAERPAVGRVLRRSVAWLRTQGPAAHVLADRTAGESALRELVCDQLADHILDPDASGAPTSDEAAEAARIVRLEIP